MAISQTRTLAVIAAWTAAVVAMGPAETRASDHAAPAAHGGAEAGGDAPPRTDILDLGLFRFRSSRPEDREVADLKFALHLLLSSKTTAAEFHRLEDWRQRLRDQVIIAIRGADPADFDDPKLRRLHRLILFRVKRLAISEAIIGVYLTDFALDRGETLIDANAPLIIPRAAPEKPVGGGGH